MISAAVKKGAGVQAVPRKRIAKLLGADLLVFTAKQSAPFFISRILVGVRIGTYACIVFEFLVDLIIAFSLPFGYTCLAISGKENNTMPATRNLCAQLPLDLHQRVCEAREQSGLLYEDSLHHNCVFVGKNHPWHRFYKGHK